jgi:hypothetical protein
MPLLYNPHRLSLSGNISAVGKAPNPPLHTKAWLSFYLGKLLLLLPGEHSATMLDFGLKALKWLLWGKSCCPRSPGGK